MDCNKNKCTCFVDNWYKMHFHFKWKFISFEKIYIGDCCGDHDYDYAFTDESRKLSDKKLYDCIGHKVNVVLASGMWIMVRSLGRFFRERSK